MDVVMILPALVLLVGFAVGFAAFNRAQVRVFRAGQRVGHVVVGFLTLMVMSMPIWLRIVASAVRPVAQHSGLEALTFLFVNVPLVMGLSALAAGLITYGIIALKIPARSLRVVH